MQDSRSRFVFLIIFAILLLFGINYWMMHTELVSGRYVTAGIPPIPAIGVLMLLVFLNPLLRKFRPQWAFQRRELVTLYIFLTISITVTATYGVRAFFPYLTAMHYFSGPEDDMAKLAKKIPSWVEPHDRELIRQLYERAHDRHVPWGVWTPYLLRWTVFFLVFFVTLLSMLTILRRRWMEEERLTFPLAYLPLNMTEAKVGTELGASFFRNPYTWIGIGMAALFNLLNILRAFQPSLPALKPVVDLSPFFTQEPWTPFAASSLTFRPEMIGLAYFVPSEVLFSGWFFYLMHRLLAVGMIKFGYRFPGAPFTQDQSAGGYVAMGLFLLWAGRAQIMAAIRKAFGRAKEVDDSREPLSYRFAVFAFPLGCLFILVWFCKVGLAWPLAVAFLGMLLCFALVFARIRAECGVPVEFIFPYGYPKEVIVNCLGTHGLLALGGTQSLVAFSTLAFLGRFGFVESSAGYQADGMRICDSTGISMRKMTRVLILGLLIGLVFAYWSHLSAYYGRGALNIEGGSPTADWRTGVALKEFSNMTNSLEMPIKRDVHKIQFFTGGFFFTLMLIALRRIFLGCPLHPVGYIIATAYGDYSPLWSAFFLIWLVKVAINRYGGLRLYRQLVPMFLGMVIGHLFIGGVVWSTISLFVPVSVSRAYYTIFS